MFKGGATSIKGYDTDNEWLRECHGASRIGGRHKATAKESQDHRTAGVNIIFSIATTIVFHPYNTLKGRDYYLSLQEQQLRLGGLKQLAQDYTENEQQSQNPNSSVWPAACSIAYDTTL